MRRYVLPKSCCVGALRTPLSLLTSSPHSLQGEGYALDAQNSLVFNICGNVTAVCAPGSVTNGIVSQGKSMYDSRGVAVQRIDPAADFPPCNTTAPVCTDFDTGAKTCCTSECEVLGAYVVRPR